MILADLLRDVEQGRFPPADMGLTVLPAPDPNRGAVVSFTGHVAIATDLDPDWVRGTYPIGDLSAAFTPPLLGTLAAKLGLRVNAIDLVALAPPLAGPPDLELTEVEDSDHPRVRRARRYRTAVRTWSCDGGMLTIGCGLAGRYEVGLEVQESHRGRGLARSLARAARHLGPGDRPLWAQIAPGNAASLRAFLAAGYRPVGQEALLVPLA